MAKSTAIPDQAVVFKGIDEGILILLDTSYDFEKLIKDAIKKIKANKKFLSENALYICGAAGSLDPDELGMARKMIRDKTKMEVFPLSKNEAPTEKIERPCGLMPLVVPNALRAGQEICHEGDVVVFGDTHPGSRILASGSVIVFGKIGGEITAGEKYAENAVIACRGLNPIRISIGNLSLQLPLEKNLSKQFVLLKSKADAIEISSWDDPAHE